MQKTTRLLKWGELLMIVLLGVMVFALSGNFYAAKADTSTVARANDPNPGSCQLVYGLSGNVSLDTSRVTDAGLLQTLDGYNGNSGYSLNCNPANMSMCTLVPGIGPSQDTVLDISNLQDPSKWIHDQLASGNYGLTCHVPSGGNSGGNSGNNGGNSGAITLGAPSGSIYRVDNCPYVNSFTGQSESDDYFDITTDNGGHVDCFATAGTLSVTLYNVSKVCTGNNTGYIIGTFDNSATFVKQDFSNRNQCYDVSPTIPVVRQITIN